MRLILSIDGFPPGVVLFVHLPGVITHVRIAVRLKLKTINNDDWKASLPRKRFHYSSWRMQKIHGASNNND